MNFTSNIAFIRYTKMDVEWSSILVKKYLKLSWMDMKKGPCMSQWIKWKEKLDFYKGIGNVKCICLAKGHTTQWSILKVLFLHHIWNRFWNNK